MKKRRKILVALSGGVDSAMAVYFLKKRGFEVFGVYFAFSSNNNWQKAENNARFLGINFYLIDLKRKFRLEIVEYFLKSYRKGLTPSPCHFCNPQIKFKYLLKLAKIFGISKVATGHYVCLSKKLFYDDKKFKKNTVYLVKKGIDKEKDQSFFLFGLKSTVLKKCLFPLGKYSKREVKIFAKEINLPAFRENESQGLCFLKKEKEFNLFIKKNIKEEEGVIVDQKDKIVGTHQGLSAFTIGQRRGVKVGAAGPYYVVKKDYKNNQLHVSNLGDDKCFFSNQVVLRFFSNLPFDYFFNKNESMFIKIRHGGCEERIVDIKIIKNGYWKITTQREMKAVAIGQFGVLYDKKGVVLGGGEILHKN